MMSLWDALRMNMMISYQELVRTFPNIILQISYRFVGLQNKGTFNNQTGFA
ncbi:Uncharacterised protein [Klebsiella quasipneumoniae]|nr:Uncharacterised protein [Klebsiella quasipneumoniae]